MGTPRDILDEVRSAASDAAGRELRVTAVSRIGGGCISPAARVEFDGAPRAFLKWAESAVTPGDLFTCEAESLEALAGAGAVRVPRVLAVAERWLLLEWLEPAPARPAGWAALGAGLARQHRSRSAVFGWPRDNYIGSLPQRNGQHADWPAFWRDRRLEPQLASAYDAGLLGRRDREAFDALLDNLHAIIGDAAASDGPSLLHGDLWRGNVHFTGGGEPALIDPSTYHGHREVDIAMAELFGGFDAAFFDAYSAEWPLQSDYATARRPVYQLYYLLVHVNLFGAGYVAGARSARDAALRATD